MSTAPPSPYAVGSPPARGDRDDRCPGSIRLHEAADGSVARVRVAGRPLTRHQLLGISSLATDLGDGTVELTSRGNLQVRALSPEDGPLVAARLHAVGLLPSETHERVRNVVVAPFAGADTDSVTAALDDALCADPALAGLSGRFLFAVRGADPAEAGGGDRRAEGGARHDVGDVPADVVLRTLDDVVPALHLARTFLELGASLEPRPWQLRELGADDAARLRAAAGDTAYALTPLLAPDVTESLPETVRSGTSAARSGVAWRRPGRVEVGGEAFVQALAPLGRVTADAVDALADVVGSRGARLAPWRAVVLPGLSDDAVATAVSTLAGIGWLIDADHPLVGHTACTGRPGCARAVADVRGDALRLAPTMTGSGQVHWSGCERRCGHPSTSFVDLVATGPGGYGDAPVGARR